MNKVSVIQNKSFHKSKKIPNSFLCIKINNNKIINNIININNFIINNNPKYINEGKFL